MKTIGIVGFGNMGEAFGAGLLKKYPTQPLFVLEKFEKQRQKALELGAKPVSSLKELVSHSDTVLICIKPQDFTEFLKELKPLAAGKKIISLAAGVHTATLQKALGTQEVVRFMPNLAAKCGLSMVGVSPGDHCSPEFAAEALEVASAAGTGSLVPEKLMAAVTGISGSGIALVLEFLHALAMGGVREGLGYAQALNFALATTEGAVGLLRDSGDHPVALVSKVCSPAGTTIEGIRILEERGVAAAVMDSVSAASRRAKELEEPPC